MLQDPMRLKITRVGESPVILLVEFTARKILDEGNIAEIGEQLTALVDREERPKLILSFGSVDHLSSAALGTLITLSNKVKQKDGQLRLSDINPQIYEVFQITRLNKLFKIYPGVKEALDSLAPQAATI